MLGKLLYRGYMVSSKLCILDHKAKKKKKKKDLGAYRSQPPLSLLLNWDLSIGTCIEWLHTFSREREMKAL